MAPTLLRLTVALLCLTFATVHATGITWNKGDQWRFREQFRFVGTTFGPAGFLQIDINATYTCDGVQEYRQPITGERYLCYKLSFHGLGTGAGKVSLRGVDGVTVRANAFEMTGSWYMRVSDLATVARLRSFQGDAEADLLGTWIPFPGVRADLNEVYVRALDYYGFPIEDGDGWTQDFTMRLQGFFDVPIINDIDFDDTYPLTGQMTNLGREQIGDYESSMITLETNGNFYQTFWFADEAKWLTYELVNDLKVGFNKLESGYRRLNGLNLLPLPSQELSVTPGGEVGPGTPLLVSGRALSAGTQVTVEFPDAPERGTVTVTASPEFEVTIPAPTSGPRPSGGWRMGSWGLVVRFAGEDSNGDGQEDYLTRTVPLGESVATPTPVPNYPVVLAAGYLSTRVTDAAGGSLSLLALTQGAVSVELGFGGAGSGFALPGGAGVHQFATELPPGLGAQELTFELIPQSPGGIPSLWPYLTVRE